MRKIFITVMLCLFGLSRTFAQGQDPWVGEWTSEAYSDIDWEASNATKDAGGTIQKVHYADFRFIIRITKSGDQYTVRGKTIKVGDPNYADYHSQYAVTQVDNNTIWLQASTSKKPFRNNGEIDEYCDITWYYKLTLENGGLHYVFYHTHSVNYDRNMRYRDTDDWDCSTYENHDLMLYNDNW